MSDHFVLGDSNCICDVCGFKYKRSQLKKRWDGAIVCSEDWEPRHPQDLIKPQAERNNHKDARLLPEIRFVGTNENTEADL